MVRRLKLRDGAPPACKRCGVAYVPIHYGFPSPEMVEQADRGEIVIGGCCIHEVNPTHACPKCERAVLIDGFEAY